MNEKKAEIFSIIKTCLIASVATLLFVAFVGKPSMVVGSSMEPTFETGDVLFVEKITKKYNRFDIIDFHCGDSVFIKRIIGLPGETVQIIDGHVYINNKQLKDVIDVNIEYAGIATEPITVGENEYFVLGDNRNNSKDSRYTDVGLIKSDKIIGRIIFGMLPPKLVK